MGAGASAAPLPTSRAEARAQGYSDEQIDAHLATIDDATTAHGVDVKERGPAGPRLKAAVVASIAFKPTREQIKAASAAQVAKPYRRPTPVRDAIRANDVKAFRELLEEDEAHLEEINFADPDDGSTCLFEAIKQNNEEVVRQLLEDNADANVVLTTNGHTPLLETAERGLPGMAAIILGEGGAEIDAVRPGDGFCSLLIAAKRGDVAFTQCLIEYGVDLEQKSPAGSTALCICVEMQHDALLKVLVDHNAELEVEDDDSATPFLVAAVNGSASTCAILLDCGANMEHCDFLGRNALMLSAANGRSEVVELLLQRGLDPDSKDEMEMTAADHATETHHYQIAKMIKGWFRG